MLLITKKTTLDKFRFGVEYFIKDPKTKRICKMGIDQVGMAYYMHSFNMHRNGGIGRYVCWNKRKGNVAVISLAALLELIQSGRFRIL